LASRLDSFNADTAVCVTAGTSLQIRLNFIFVHSLGEFFIYAFEHIAELLYSRIGRTFEKNSMFQWKKTNKFLEKLNIVRKQRSETISFASSLIIFLNEVS
jgi:hypothetical protein